MNNIKRKRRPRLDSVTAAQGISSHHLRLPSEMENWLSEFAFKNGFNSTMEAARFVLREKMQLEIEPDSDKKKHLIFESVAALQP